MSSKNKKALKLALHLRAIRDLGADDIAAIVGNTSRQTVNNHYKKFNKVLEEAGL